MHDIDDTDNLPFESEIPEIISEHTGSELSLGSDISQVISPEITIPSLKY
jgi:hypothetical protein